MFKTAGERIVYASLTAAVMIVFLVMNPLMPRYSLRWNPGSAPARVGASPCEYPLAITPDCVGLPSSISEASLTTTSCEVDGSAHAVTTPNSTLDRVKVPCHLLIEAENVTITNSIIEGTVYNDYCGAPVVYCHYDISDSTITSNAVTAESPTGCITQPALAWARYTATRVEMRNHDDGPRVSTPGYVTITDSYEKLCWNTPTYAPPDGSHSGGLQFTCSDEPTYTDDTCYNTVFNHNTVDNSSVDSSGTPQGNSGITAQSCSAPGTGCGGSGINPISGFTANRNLLMGGGYVMWPWWSTAPAYEIHDNRIVDKSWAGSPIDGNGTCAGQNWSGNTIVTIDNNTFDQTNLPTTEYHGNYQITSTVRTVNCDNS